MRRGDRRRDRRQLERFGCIDEQLGRVEHQLRQLHCFVERLGRMKRT